MKRLNNLFILLFIIIGLLSVSYIWKSEAEKKDLETTSDQKSQEISFLKNRISQLEETQERTGEIQGLTTEITGTILGKVQINNSNYSENIIICAQDKFTIKEFCTDELVDTSDPNESSYSLEIPKGKYLIYAVTPPDDKKTYYSEVKKCTGDDICENNKKILLEVIEAETQKDINLYL